MLFARMSLGQVGTFIGGKCKAVGYRWLRCLPGFFDLEGFGAQPVAFHLHSTCFFLCLVDVAILHYLVLTFVFSIPRFITYLGLQHLPERIH